MTFGTGRYVPLTPKLRLYIPGTARRLRPEKLATPANAEMTVIPEGATVKPTLNRLDAASMLPPKMTWL